VRHPILREESQHLRRHKDRVVLTNRLDNLLALLQGAGERLLAHHRLARLDSGQRIFGVPIGGGADVDNLALL
jgi:hypothetical protein